MPQREIKQGEKRFFGISRSRHILLSNKLSGVLDYSPSCGWHECNEKYMVRRENSANLMDCYLMIFTVNGEGRATVGREEYILRRGSCMIFPKGISHSYYVPRGGKWDFYWIHLRGPMSEALLPYIVQEYGRQFNVTCRKEIAEYIELLINTEYRYYEYEMFAAQIIFKLLFAVLGDQSCSAGEAHPGKTRALQVIEYIEANYQKPLKLSEISQQLYLSSEHLIRLFKAETGTTPYQYVKEYRMCKACQLLDETDMSVAEVSAAVGYSSQSSFIAQFKQCYHTTPQAYRKATC